MIDVLDENGVKTGQVASRAEVHRLGLWHRVIAVAIINGEGKLLLQQRSANKDKNAGLWDISVAGHIAAGQDSLSAAAREINEEIGWALSVEVKVRDFRYMTCFRREQVYPRPGDDFIERQFHDFFVLYEKDLTDEKLLLQESEVQAAKFVSADELKEMIEQGIVVDRAEIWPILIEDRGGVHGFRRQSL